MTPHPLHPHRPRRTGGGCLSGAVYLIILAAGAGVLYGRFYEPIREMISSQHWVRVPCKIHTSFIEPAKAPGTFKPNIGYYYRWEDEPKSRRSADISFFPIGSDTKTDVEAVVARYPKGLETYCYVNPDNPDQAVLQRGFRPALLLALFPLAMVLIGLAGLTNLIWRRAFPRARLHPALFGPRTHQTPSGLPTHTPRPGPVTLRARRGLKSGLTFVLIAALLWNSMMFFLAREVINNWRGGTPGPYGVLLTLFSIPFLLAGLLLLILPFFIIRRLFLPRPTITLSEPMVPVGSSIDLSWRVSGRIDRIRRLRILLEGREEAAYERDGDLRAEQETFASIPIHVSPDPQRIRSGRCTLRVPHYTIHSFESRHNKIAWVVRLVTDSRPWPGFDEEFDLLVLPAPASGSEVAPQPRLTPAPSSPSPQPHPEAHPA